MTDIETDPAEETRPPKKTMDHRTLMVVIGFGIALLALVGLNMN